MYDRAMSIRDRVELLTRTLISNPFDVSAASLRSADDALTRLDLASALIDLLSDGNVERAKLLLLAAGHRRACQHPDAPERVFERLALPKAVTGRLPRPLGDYLRVVMAAGRCHRVLSGIRGTSALLQRARRETWAACFGDSLRHALDLERVIRDHDVLILGETGTGKESFARAFQAATLGPDDGSPAPSAAINAAALPETLVESELFGHARGAFTGATETRIGRLRSADGGAFFLDEVGDLPRTTQVKLLRVIETNEVFPLGSDTPHHVDLRYVAATHKDLEGMVERRAFRRDLFERLAGNVIRIPPLRRRSEDLRAIALPFVSQYLGANTDHPQLAVIEQWLDSDEARGYSWPGNVRELQNVLRNLLLGLPSGIAAKAPPTTRAIPEPIAAGEASLREVEQWYLRRVLSQLDGNLSQAAKALGVDRSTLRRRLLQ
ncbi:MAG: hypothetical protein Tsb0020_16450 [Haliangiales bacterium]